jgi:hypothetical protein
MFAEIVACISFLICFVCITLNIEDLVSCIENCYVSNDRAFPILENKVYSLQFMSIVAINKHLRRTGNISKLNLPQILKQDILNYRHPLNEIIYDI